MRAEPRDRLIDERARPGLAAEVRTLLRTARRVDLALRRIRLAGLQLDADDLAAVASCRLLLGRLDAATLIDAGDDARADPRRLRGLVTLRDFVCAGRLQARAAGVDGWAPDFSRYHEADAAGAALIGAHYFSRPAPLLGAALTVWTAAPAALALLDERFAALWAGGHDVTELLAEVLIELAGPPPRLLVVREARPDPGTSPREVALALLEARFGPADDVTGGLPLAPHQETGLRRARRVLRERGGVVLADRVGSGKTRIALALIEAALTAEAPSAEATRVLVITPSALRARWLAELRALCGRLHVGPPVDGGRGERARVTWLSHARLSRGEHRPELHGGATLVVVDEAHAFRSPHTRRYHALRALCRGPAVVLVTATPINNTPLDLLALLRLFSADGAFVDRGVASLRASFAAAAAGAEGREDVARVATAVLVRSGGPLLDAAGAPMVPRVHRPRVVACDYAVGAAGLDPVLARLRTELRGAPYRLADYGADRVRSVPAAVDLLRMLFLKRLESSPAALVVSVGRQLRFLRDFVAALDGGRLLVPADRFDSPGDGDVLQLVLEALTYRALPRGLAADALRADVEGDIALLESLHALARSLARSDPKIAALRALLDGLRGEKVIIFSEYRDTARNLWQLLLPRGGVALVDGSGAWLGAQPYGRRAVIERFAPAANGVAPPAAHERVDTLIATDVLAEGLDLQDARVVVSYDLPWNPVRLIQRLGRVRRLASPHGTVQAVYFTPDPRVEAELTMMARLRGKLETIERVLGADVEVIANRVRAGDTAALDELERAGDPAFEREALLESAFHATPGAAVPPGRWSALWSSAAPAGSVLVALRLGTKTLLVLVGADGSVRFEPPEASALLLEALHAGTSSPAPYPDAAIARARAACAALGERAGATDARASRLARLLLLRAAAHPGGLTAPLAERIDRALARLRAGVTVTLDPGAFPAADLLALLATLEAGAPERLPGVTQPPVLIGALAVGAPCAGSPPTG